MIQELQQLKDIHLPPPISPWPLAPGWIAMAILFLLLCGYSIQRIYIHHKKQRTIKFALRQLSGLEKMMADNPNNINIAAEVSTLLRRTALYYFPREEIAGLTGQAWLQFLNNSSGTNDFNQEIGYLLTDTPYRKENNADLIPLIAISRAWLIKLSKRNKKIAEK